MAKLLLRGVVFLGVAMLPAFAIAGGFGALLSSWAGATNTKVSAYKVLSKQINLAGERTVSGTLQSFQAGSTAILANMQSQQVQDAVMRFGSAGQGAFPCYATEMSKTTGLTRAKLLSMVGTASGQVAGWNAGSDTDRRVTQISLHKNVYCSVSEHKLGVCKLNDAGLQSADADFAFLVKGGTKSSSERGAGYDFVDNVIPQRQATACGTPECYARASDDRGRNAVDSLARMSFIATIEARSQQTATPAP
jgi:hypothetical protein